MDHVLSDLQNARAYLLEFGWHQGAYVPGYYEEWYSQPACMEGAIICSINPKVGHSQTFSSEVSARLWAASVALENHTGGKTVAEFNDEEERTFEGVIRVFDRAIADRERQLEEFERIVKENGNV